MPPPSQWERTSTVGGSAAPGRILVLQGAARAWMIVAIVWGSIVFVGQNVARGIGNNNNTNNHSMFVQINSVHPDPSGLTHVIGQVPTEVSRHLSGAWSLGFFFFKKLIGAAGSPGLRPQLAWLTELML